MSRLDPLPIKQWPEGMRAAMAALTPPNQRHPFPRTDGDRSKGRNILGLLAHHPELATAWQHFNGHVLFQTTLTERQRELLVLRVAHARGNDYEWRQHVIVGKDVGLTEEEIERLAQAADTIGWDPLDAALVQAADELVADARLSEPTWCALVAELDIQQVMDVIFTVGCYDLLAMLIASAQLPFDDDLPT